MVESFSLNPFEEQNGEGDAESTRSGRADFSDIGRVVEVSGGSSSIRLDGRALKQLDGHQDITVAMAGQVGSQIKVRVGGLWLLANVRDMRLENPDGDLIVSARKSTRLNSSH